MCESFKAGMSDVWSCSSELSSLSTALSWAASGCSIMWCVVMWLIRKYCKWCFHMHKGLTPQPPSSILSRGWPKLRIVVVQIRKENQHAERYCRTRSESRGVYSRLSGSKCDTDTNMRSTLLGKTNVANSCPNKSSKLSDIYIYIYICMKWNDSKTWLDLTWFNKDKETSSSTTVFWLSIANRCSILKHCCLSHLC